MNARGRFVILALVAVGLAGCAADPRYKQGLEWVQWNEMEKARLDAAGSRSTIFTEAEKRRLNRAGFPHYAGPS